jgi:hypothetical protein
MYLRRAIGLPVVLLVTFAVPLVSVSHARTSLRNKPIYFVHGINNSAYTDCAMWNPMTAQFDRWLGLVGKNAETPEARRRRYLTVAYYFQDKNCTANTNTSHPHSGHPGPTQPGLQGPQPHRQGSHTGAAPIEHLAYHLAWDIYNRHSSKGRSVAVVAHSMGGLLIRYALAAVALHHPDFPPLLRIDDVVTLGTPHGGARGPWPSFEGAEMVPGSDFLKSLQRVPRPEGVGGTDWLTVGSDDDTAVAADRAVGTDRDRDPLNKYFDSQHKVWYTSVNDIEHGGYYKLHAAATNKGAVAYESLSSSPFLSHVVAMTWPVRRTYLSLTSARM